MMMRRPVRIALVLLAGLSLPARAQITGAVDVGVGSNHPDQALSGAVASFAPVLRVDAGRFHFGAQGVYSSGERWNAQGSATGSVRSGRLGPLEAELSTQFDWTLHDRVGGTKTIAGEARAYVYPTGNTTIWLGHSVGRASSLSRWRPLQRNQLGTAVQLGKVWLGLSLASTSFDLMPLPGPRTAAADTLSGGRPDSLSSVRSGFTDAMVSGHWRVGAWELGGGLGHRFGQKASRATLWSVTTARDLSRRIALIVAAGRMGSDPVTMLPGSRYVIAGFRMKFGASAPAGDAVAIAPAATATGIAFRVGPPLPAGREITLRAPHARSVELTGDFTNWQPLPLAAVGRGEWRGVTPIEPGLHRVAVRFDGGEWQVPAGTRPVESDFGGEVGAIVVE